MFFLARLLASHRKTVGEMFQRLPDSPRHERTLGFVLRGRFIFGIIRLINVSSSNHHVGENFVWKVLKLGGFNLTILSFYPYLGKWSNLTNMFQRGWNHQLENHLKLKQVKVCFAHVHSPCSFCTPPCWPPQAMVIWAVTRTIHDLKADRDHHRGGLGRFIIHPLQPGVTYCILI